MNTVIFVILQIVVWGSGFVMGAYWMLYMCKDIVDDWKRSNER